VNLRRYASLVVGLILFFIGVSLTFIGTKLPEDITLHPNEFDYSVIGTTNVFIMGGLVVAIIGVSFVIFWIVKRIKLPKEKLTTY